MVDLGLLQPIVRAPLVMPSEQTRAKVREIVGAYRAAKGA
jgi:hypothetical protein